MYLSAIFQSISAKNKANRARQKFSHTSGKKSFARIREEEVQYARGSVVKFCFFKKPTQ